MVAVAPCGEAQLQQESSKEGLYDKYHNKPFPGIFGWTSTKISPDDEKLTKSFLECLPPKMTMIVVLLQWWWWWWCHL